MGERCSLHSRGIGAICSPAVDKFLKVYFFIPPALSGFRPYIIAQELVQNIKLIFTMIDTRKGTTISRYRSKRQKSRVTASDGDMAGLRSAPASNMPSMTSLAITDSARVMNGVENVSIHPSNNQTESGTILMCCDVAPRNTCSPIRT